MGWPLHEDLRVTDWTNCALADRPMHGAAVFAKTAARATQAATRGRPYTVVVYDRTGTLLWQAAVTRSIARAMSLADEHVRRGVGIYFAPRDLRDERVEAAIVGVGGDDAIDQALAREGEELVAGLRAPLLIPHRRFTDVRAVLLEGVGEIGDAIFTGR